MTSTTSRTLGASAPAARLGISTALAAVMLAGCTTHSAPQANLSGAQPALAEADHARNEAVELAEMAVATNPQDGALRAQLGNAYLDAGRFASAQSAYDEALALGQNSPRVALSLALSLAGQAKYQEASTLLDTWEGMLAPADIGLAYTLAGQPGRGIHIMINAIRAGDDTVKMRQNLAYAFAADGRWREARVMVAQDLPAGEVGARMAEWANLAQSRAYQHRVAALLQVPVASHDPGQPAHLALSGTRPVQATTQGAAISAGNDMPSRPLAELPPAAHDARGQAGDTDTLESALARMEQRETIDAQFQAAFAPADPVRETLASVTTDSVRFISDPVVQETATKPHMATGSADMRKAGGTHLVQLGSFLSERAAVRAWDIYRSRYPELARHKMVITQAMVGGKRHFRVSAAGYDRHASRAMCSRVKQSGGEGCISWAASTPLPGALDQGIRLAHS